MLAELLTDLHISNALPYSKPLEDGTTDRLRDIASFLLRFVKRKPEIVIIGGDVFDKRRLDAVTLKVGTRILRKLAEVSEVIIVPGNHDTEDAAGNHNTVQYLEALGKGAYPIRIMKPGEVFRLGDLEVHVFPYLPPSRFAESVSAARPNGDRPSVAIFHQAIKGAMQGGTPFPTTISSSLFGRFDLAIGGHVHHKQRIGNVVFLGSTYNLDFREANEAQGSHSFDSDTLDLKFEPSGMPRFRIFDGAIGEFDRDDYVIIKNFDEKPSGKARLLIAKPRESESAARARLDVDTERFSWIDAIRSYVELKAPENDRATLIELGKRLLGDMTSRASSVPGLVTFKTIEARDFLGFKQLEPLSLDRPGATLIVGRNRDTSAANSNGSGKSTIFRALTWALYGELIEDADVIRRGAMKAIASLTFTKGEDEYEIERTRTKSRATLRLSLNGKDISSEGSIKSTQETISRVLGLDFLSFRNSVLFGQGDRMRFAAPDLKDEERKRIFRSALDIDDLIKVAQRNASAARAKQGAKLDEAERIVDDCSRWIVRLESEAASLDEQWSHAETAKTERVKTAEAELADLPDVSTLRERLDGLTATRDAELEKCGSIEGRSKALEDCDAKISKLDAAAREATIAMVSIREALKPLYAGRARFEKGFCPTCGTKRGESLTFDAHLEDIEREIARLETELDSAKARTVDAEGAKSKAGARRSTLNDELQAAMKHRRNADTIAASISGLTVKIEHVDRERDRVKREIETLKAMSNPYAERRSEVRAEVESKRVELVENESTLAKARRGVELLEFWIKGFGNKGIASFVVELFLPRLERHANEYLEILSDGDIRLALSATTTTRKGTETEEISVSYHVEGIEDALPSGGQLKKIEIAIDLAFMRILAERDGAEIGLVILDEILDGLDTEGRARVMMLVDVLRRSKGTAFVISHDADLHSSFDDVIVVVRKGGVSSVIA